MSFTDTVQRKIEARRMKLPAEIAAAADREARLRMQAAPLIAAIEALRDVLSEDSMFAAAIGKREMTLEPQNDPLATGDRLKLPGRAADLRFVLRRDNRIEMSIDPGWAVLVALQCPDMRYRSAVKGDMAHLDAFMALVEDRIADFLADVALSSAAHVLQADKPAGVDFGGLTRF